MTSLSHYATCKVWSSGYWNSCDCRGLPLWRIRKESGELFPWRVWRYTDDDVYEPLMRCSTFDGARELVAQFEWLRRQTNERGADV